jgi:hypothetical protein
MPGWYLILSAAVGLLVLAGVAYSALVDARRRELPGGVGAGFDQAYADAPTRREAEEAPRRRVGEREELVQRRR